MTRPWPETVNGCEARAKWHAHWAERDRKAVKALEALGLEDNLDIEHAILTLEASADREEENASYFAERAKKLAANE
jgi:hypothetical protein